VESATQQPAVVTRRRTRGQAVMAAAFLLIIGLLIASVAIWLENIRYSTQHILHLANAQERARDLISLRTRAHEHTIAMYRALRHPGLGEFGAKLSESLQIARTFDWAVADARKAMTSRDEVQRWSELEDVVSAIAALTREIQEASAEGRREEATQQFTSQLIPLQEEFNVGLSAVIELHQRGVEDEIATAQGAHRGAYFIVFLLSAIVLLLTGLMIFTLRRTARAERDLVQHHERIRALYELASVPGRTAEQQNQDLLREGCRLLGTEIAELCRIDTEQRIVQFVDTWCLPDLDIKPGSRLPLDKTFCSIVFQTDRGIAVSDVGRSEYRSYPCYEFSRLESYIAAPVWIDGKRYGTVNFSARTPRAKPFTDADRDLVNLIGKSIATNLERARMQEILLAKETAEAESRTKSSFLASMSHELRTPLNAIIGYSELLIEDARERRDDLTLPDLSKIRYAGVYLLSLIDDVLDFSRLESDKIELHFEYIDGRRMISEIAESVLPLMQKNRNALKVTIDDSLGILFCDIKRTRQILFNLLSNAAKFTDQGTVTLNARRDGAGEAAFVVFEIADTGIGISPEQQANLFKPFGQADQGIARKFGGTGLGLVISRRFTQLMGGDLTLKSESGKGSCFKVTLPTDIQRRKLAASRSR
jgi:signal transduction histidine kinase